MRCQKIREVAAARAKVKCLRVVGRCVCSLTAALVPLTLREVRSPYMCSQVTRCAGTSYGGSYASSADYARTAGELSCTWELCAHTVVNI
mmetsp:Transcript_60090/g.159841  ORF Transcript_60090/g.159841 Transcript_60090/m.159841 type:complete len:90 (-) Transcript_60090:276-545(-)